MKIDFYDQPDFKYPELAICMEDTDGPIVKVYIPIATPTLTNNLIYDTKSLPIDISNIKSNNIAEGNLSRVTESNYIELKLPDDKSASKGDKFIIVFIGGDVNRGVLIGRYNQ